MRGMDQEPANEVDYRFSLANERTFLSWLRTAVALIAGGAVAAKALAFDSDALRWIVAVPPILAGAAVALRSRGRLRRYESAMRSASPLPASRDSSVIAIGLAVYALVVLVALVADG